MKKNRAIILSIFVAIMSLPSCSFFNKKTVELAIDSSPQGAGIFINERIYGITPAVINVEPKEHIISLSLNGHGSTSFQTPIFWGSIRTKADGSINADGVRCFLDFVSVLFSFQAYTGKCADFKQKKYNVSIPKSYVSSYPYESQRGNRSPQQYQYPQQYPYDGMGGGGFGNPNSSSIVGVGRSPENMINYYYNQDLMRNSQDYGSMNQ